MGVVKPLKKIKSYRKSYTLIDDGHPKIKLRNLYKYMDLETAIICLKNKSIRFVQPSEWPDKYERHFYGADYSNITTDKNIIPRVWACCFTTSKMSEASWNTYRYGKTGLGNKCVKFQISRSKFREMICKDNRVLYSVEGLMNYDLSDYDIKYLHKKKSNYYHKIFDSPFTLEKYFSLLLIKRSAFNYENEFRFMITSSNIKEEESKVFINIDWSKLIEKIEIDKDATDVEIEILKSYLKKAGVPESIINETKCVMLYDDPIEKVVIE